MRSIYTLCAAVAFGSLSKAQATTGNGSAIGSLTDPDLNTTRCADFCAGTNTTGDPATHICGDLRLGPIKVPEGLPLEGIVGSESTYRRFGGACPGEFLAQWTNATSGNFEFPPFDGYVLTPTGEPGILNISLQTGTLLDRFGTEFGRYTSPAGTPYAQRSLPPWNLNAAPGSRYPYNYQVYIVTRRLEVQTGPIAGWFGQQGLGLQFLMPRTVGELVGEGYLLRINRTADPFW